MKKLLITISLLLTLGFASSGVAAQSDGVQAPDLEGMEASYDIEGLQSIHDRTFSVDFEAMLASPDADFESLDMSAMMNLITIQGVTFDNEDNAKAYMGDMKSELEQAGDEGEDAAFEDMEISDLDGFDVDGLRVDMNMPDLEVAASMIVFVDGNHVFQIMVMDADLETAQASADEVAQFVLDTEVENEEVSFSEDGTSTGGVFDRMPTADDDLAGDLTGVMDSELFVADE